MNRGYGTGGHTPTEDNPALYVGAYQTVVSSSDALDSESHQDITLAAILANDLPDLADGEILQIQIRNTGKWLTITNATDLAVINDSGLHYNWQITNRAADAVEDGAVRLFAEIINADTYLSARRPSQQAHAQALMYRIQIWEKLREGGFEVDPEFIANSGISKQRAAKSFGHVIVEGFLKGFGLVLFAALSKSWFDGTLTKETPEEYSKLSWAVWGSLVAIVTGLTYYNAPNMYHFATRTFSELDESEMDRLYYDDAAMHNYLSDHYRFRFAASIGIATDYDPDVKGIYLRNDVTIADIKTCQRTAVAVLVTEQFDAFDVAMVLFLLKIAASGTSKGASYTIALAIGVIAGLPLKACAALANSTSQAQNKRQAEVFFKTGALTILYDRTIPLLNTESRRLAVYKILLIGLPILFGGVHAGAAFKLDMMENVPFWAKAIIGFALSLGALAKTGTYDMTRVADAIGLDRQMAERPYKTECLNTTAYYVAALSPKLYDNRAKRFLLLGPSYWLGLTALMFKALEAFLEGVVIPYSETLQNVLETKVSGEDHGIKVLHVIAFVIAAWGAATQTMQGIKSFNEKAKQASVTGSTALLQTAVVEDPRMITCKGMSAS